MKTSPLLITDRYSNLQSKKKGSIVFIWDEFSVDKNYISIPNLVEEKADKYRSEFLEWIHFFSQTKINGITLYNHLKLDDDFPFWWTTSLGQRFNIHDGSQINDVIKSMAFHDYLIEKKIKPSLVEVCSEKRGLVDFLKGLPEIKNLKIIKKKLIRKHKKSVFLYGLFIFRFVLYQFFQNQSKSLKKIDFVFFDIFTHLKDGDDFKSNYWTKLVNMIKKKSVVWNHIYYRSKKKYSYINSSKRIKLFNKKNSKHRHKFLEQNFSFKIYLKIINNYFKIKKKAKALLPSLSKSFRCNKRGIDFSSWIKDDFANSISGQEALKNCYYILLVKEAVNRSPISAKAIYIQEFQSWEIALVFYWKKAGRRKIIGMPHSTHRYWDLRYFFGKSFFSLFSNDIFPDQIVINGSYSLDRCIENGYPRSILKPVEALRYIHHPSKPKPKNKLNHETLNILVCFDYQIKTSEELLRIVDEVTRENKEKYNVKVRMHPSFPIPTKLLKKYNFKVSDENLIPALQKSDWVITSNLSAIAVDAFYQGCKIGQLSDGLYFNLSPLRGVIDNLFFADSKELKNMLETNKENEKEFEYFFIDHKLSLWKNILFNNKT